MSWCEVNPARDGLRKVLVLQGGGALGSYQAGGFEALDEACFCPEWIAGTSIGAINGAIIAGNRPADRLARLREFWELVTSGLPAEAMLPGAAHWQLPWQAAAAAFTASFGAPGFFRPMLPPVLPWLRGPLGYYDTGPLRATLERLVDWDLLNSGDVRLSVGAVNVETGNFRYFDTEAERLGPEHVMASGALPPGFPPIEIDGCYWWDGGIVSNTPLEHVLDDGGADALLVLQVDLFPARGALPETINDAEDRVSEIRFSSRTRSNTTAQMRVDRARDALRALVARLPDTLRESAEVAELVALARERRVAIGQVIYRDKAIEGLSRDNEFSRATMRTRWASGKRDMTEAVARALVLAQALPEGVTSHDLLAPRPEAEVPLAAE